MADNPMTVRDIDVPFWRIVVILIKWSIAAIPAFIVVIIIYALIGAVVAGIIGAIGLSIPDIPAPPN